MIAQRCHSPQQRNARMSIFPMMTSGRPVVFAPPTALLHGPQGENFTVATSIIGSRTFPSWLRAMRRVDLMDDPRFSSAAARRLNFGVLHQVIQSWILTFPDMATLDAQFDEAKIAMGEIRSIKDSRHRMERLWALSNASLTAAAASIGRLAGRAFFGGS
jgi:crotonobetainyl-CoA:carnitine CoA-transferase CaiB-like acyl-CoA transferase